MGVLRSLQNRPVLGQGTGANERELNMPYTIRKTGPKSKPWCVFNKVTGAKKGCSVTEAMAKKFMAKLYVEEGKKNGK